MKALILLNLVVCFSYVVSYITSVYYFSYNEPLILEAVVLATGIMGTLTIYTFAVKSMFETC